MRLRDDRQTAINAALRQKDEEVEQQQQLPEYDCFHFFIDLASSSTTQIRTTNSYQ